MTSRTQKMEQYLDDLALIVDGDRDAIARHADFLADDDEARDLRHEASGVVTRIAGAGADYVPPADLEARLLAALDARGGSGGLAGGGLESAGRKTDPGFVVDPVGAPASTGPSSGVGAMPSRQDFGSTVRTDAFAPTQAMPSVEAPAAQAPIAASAIPATQALAAVEVAEVAPQGSGSASQGSGSASQGSGSASQGPRSASQGSGSASQASNVVSLAEAREKKGASPAPSGGKLGRVILFFGGLTAIAAAAAAGVIAIGSMGPGGVTTALGGGGEGGETPVVASLGATTARVVEIVRAAGGDPGTGVEVRAAGGAFAAASPDATVPAGGTIRTDARTRVRLALSDGSEVVLNHGTELAIDATVPRRFSLASGELVADIEHLEDGPNASFRTPTGQVEVVGTKFDLTATTDVASVRVTRGKVRVTSGGGTAEVDQGEEGVLRTTGTPQVSPAIDLARAVAWAELGSDLGGTANVTPEETSIPGIGSLRARRPGEREDRERPLAVSSANVRIRISGNVARTEIEQVFQNDGASELEGIYRFPLPSDARVARLALDVNGELEEGAFVARNRAQRIWRGVIRNATPVAQRRPTEDFIWVPGPWRDPALLEWQRGGNFELRIYPIPAQGSRRVVLAYTQIVRPHGSERRYVYPLPVSRDGSTRIGQLNVDVRIAGAQAVRAAGYDVTQGSEEGATTLRYDARDFVPNGDLVIDYALPGGEGELAYWAYQGQAAAAPPERSRDRDTEVVEAQRRVAADQRGYVSFALRPRLPARTEGRAQDYVIVVDSSQSMVGERFTRASRLVAGMLAEMDRRDRFTVLACDYECRSIDGGANASRSFRTPTSAEVRTVTEWLGQVEPAGASDLGATLRHAARMPQRDPAREVHVIYVGDGVASVGHRSASALAEEAEEISTRERVSITTVGIGGDADTVALAALARAGHGHYVPYVPGERASSAALAVLETTYGVSLEDASFELPAGLSDVAPASLPTIRAGEEVLVVARLDQPEVSGDLVLRGTVGGEPFEQRYPVQVRPSSSAGNLFVPAQWAAGTIERLELEGRGEDEARIIALSKAYSVMSRHTSLLVLESESMFRAFGIDRQEQATAWTGDEAAQGHMALGTLGVAGEEQLLQGALASADVEDMGAGEGAGALMGGGGGTGSGYGVGGGGLRGRASASTRSGGGMAPTDGDSVGLDDGLAARADRAMAEPMEAEASTERAEARRQGPARPTTSTAAAAAPAATPAAPMGGMVAQQPAPRGPGQWMRRVFVRVGDIATSNEISFREQEAARAAEQQLAILPDSRDRHRAAVRALARAGNVSRALEVAEAWIARDRMDPEALVARADLLARSGHRDEALRVLTGIVDLRPDDAALQERLASAFDRAGQQDRSCAHRVALAEIDTASADKVGAALRCERALGRSSMADVLLRSVREESVRTRAERVAGTPAEPARTRGELFVDASWSGGDDLDLTLIAPDGSRISWMGGRTNVVAGTPFGAGSETLGLRSATVGNYQIEVSRTSASDRRPITGELRVRVLDETQTIRFTLRGERETVGRAVVRREERMEAVGGGGW